ncbi:FAD-binding oxidoreductase [Nisaea acidiphila]|uniref:FAD-binding oxidoreductase n=1 Tax=Nisaea acidiphila TaxID=1862145 RepID=A0A9J7AR96_9PROT|nr:FAD-binding oxidoreductase [Nisaea acidiphila]UUX49896.1 FAD-binding oxidoreductase [Nisaea acidiphila]
MNDQTPQSIDAALAEIRAALGPKGWLEDANDTLKYRTDWRGAPEGEALGVARPASTEETAAVVRAAAKAGICIVPQGGNTGLAIGSVPTEPRPTIVLSTDRLTAVRTLDPDNYAMVAEAGCIIQNMQAVAAEAGRLFPLSLASEGSSTVGGTLSTNAGGNNTIKYGNTREQILGIEAVLADGSVFDGLETLRKNNTGYDMKQLFIGAEGTLGIVTAAAFRLMPLPRVRETAMLAVPSPHEAQHLLTSAREMSGDTVLAFEIMPRASFDMALKFIDGIVDPLAEPSPWYVLLEMGTSSPLDDLRAKLEAIFAEAMEKGWVTDGVIAESEAQRRELWRIREEQAEAGKREGTPRIAGDVSVPVSRVADYLEQSQATMNAYLPGLFFNCFGHMGDGNIHYTARKPASVSEAEWEEKKPGLTKRMYETALALGGSISAEHGIGSEKLPYLEKYGSPSKIALMKSVKQALDPKNIMNPGKVIP